YTIMFLLIVTFGDVYRVIATLAVTSIFSSSWLIAMQTFVTQTEFKGKAVGRYLSTYSMGWFIAGILGGYISDSISVRAALVTGAVFSALAMFIFLPVKEERLRGVTLSLGEYLRVFRNRNMVIVGAVAVLTILIRSSFFSFIPVYFVDIIGGSKFLFGLSMSAGTLAGAVISGLLGALSDRIGRKPLLVLGNAIGILYFPLFLLTVDPTLVAVLFAMPVYPFIMTSLTALASDYSPTRIRGRAMGFLNTCVQGGRAVGPLIGGALALTKELVAIQRILVFATIGSVFITFLSWRFVTEGLIRQPQQVR
ncbi:MAG: MFS transporter, partial [Candidatus Bathyarchaeia archaeon]